MQKTHKNSHSAAPSVAIILLNWNNEADCIDCLRSLEKITYPNARIFLVDNGSREESVAALRPFCNNGVTLVETGENLGFSGGNNVGIRKALAKGFDYILLLNNDTTVAPDFLDHMVAAAESNEAIGVVGPKIYYYSEPERIWYGGGDFSWFHKGKHVHYNAIDKNPDEKELKETKYVTGCAFFAKAEAIKKAGLMPEEFFLYHEDVDWSMSFKKAGYRAVYAPAAKVYHKVSRTTSALGSPKVLYYDTRNALLLASRHAPPAVRALVYCASALYYAKQIVKIIILPSRRAASRMIKKGIEDFYKGRFGKLQEIS